MKHLITLLLACFTATAFAITDYKAGDELYVHAPSGLKLRNTPDGETVLTTIPYGTKLKVLENRGTVAPKTVDGLKGFWAKVTYDGKTGYLFDGYLSYLPTPKPGHTTLSQYCDDFFKPTSPILTQSLSCDDEVTDENTVQLFNFGTRPVVLTNNHGYEWSGEWITITNLSVEEGWLLAKAIYKADFDSAIKFYAEHPDDGSTKEEGFDLELFSIFKNTYPSNKCFELHFPEDCGDNTLEIVQRKNILYIKRWGGC